MTKKFTAISLTILALTISYLPAMAEDLQPAAAASQAPEAQAPQASQVSGNAESTAPAAAETPAAQAQAPQEVSADSKQASDTNKDGASLAQVSDTKATDGGAAAPAKAAKPAKQGSFTGRFVKSIVPFTTGVVIGTPIAVVRHSYQDTVEGNRDLLGQSKNFFTYLFFPLATTVSLPFGCFSGALEGAFYGPWNSAKYADEKPYSKESFSLGSM
jgi:hypothetical protein